MIERQKPSAGPLPAKGAPGRASGGHFIKQPQLVLIACAIIVDPCSSIFLERDCLRYLRAAAHFYASPVDTYVRVLLAVTSYEPTLLF